MNTDNASIVTKPLIMAPAPFG
ncbi:hypothetical protein [Parasedimentitalea marina]